MIRRFRFAIAMAFILGAGASARANILFNTFGPGNSYNTSIGYNIGGANKVVPATLGFAFTPTATGVLDQIEVALMRNYFFDPSINLGLYSDNGSGQLGALIEGFSNVGPADPFGSILTIGSSMHPILTAGTTYWLIGSPTTADTLVAWMGNTIGAKGKEYFNTKGNVSYNNNLDMPAFRLTGSAVTPEPGSLALAASGALGLALVVRARRRPR